MRTTLAWALGVLAVTAVACSDNADDLTGAWGGELAAAAGGRPLSADLTGAAEVPGPGDPDGSGTAEFRLNPGLQTVCWEVTWTDIEEPTGAHIHRGTADVAGPIVIPLDPIAEGCAEGVDRALILEIIRDPDAFYANVHNADFPGGAIRGQLSN